MSQTSITDIGTVGIPVSDQDKAVEFFTGTLGFEKRLDARMGELPLGHSRGLRCVHVGRADRQA
jgi:catechol 2,3-dioxygenase-like lactoylglutathione lyase family enzyme